MTNSGKFWLTSWSLAWFFLLSTVVWSQEARVIVEPEPPEVNRRLVVRFELHGQSMKSFQAPKFPEDWKMLGRPVQGPSQSIVNGKLHYKEMVQYTFLPDRPGKYRLGPATFSSRGRQYRTEPITVEILSRQDAIRRKEALRAEKNARLRKSVRNDLFIRATVSRKTVYQGEQLIISYKLYKRINFSLRDWEKLPRLTGFWTEELKEARETQRTTIDGKPFTVIELKKFMAFPQVSGKLEVDPLELSLVAAVPQSREEGYDPFGGFGSIFGRTQNVELTVASPPVTVEVKPLPPGAPAGFDGLVGRYDWNVDFGEDSLSVGDGYSLDIEVSGAGNIDLLQPFELDLPASLEQYDPQVEKSSRIRGGKWVGRKQFTYLIIPRQRGKYTIPPLRMVYFDPEEARYHVLEEPARTFAALNSAGTTAGEKQRPIPVQAGNEVPTLQETIRDIKREEPSGIRPLLWGPDKWRFWLVYGAPVLLFLLGGWLRRYLIQMPGDSRQSQYRRLKRRLQHLDKLDTAQQLAGIEKVLNEYLFLRYNLQASTMSREELEQAMYQKGIATGRRKEWFRIRERLNYFRYAPDQTAQDIGQLREASLEWIQAPQTKQSA